MGHLVAHVGVDDHDPAGSPEDHASLAHHDKRAVLLPAQLAVERDRTNARTIGAHDRLRSHADHRCCTESGVAPQQTTGVDLDQLEVDNVCYQVIADPRRFDVLVTPNMLGDIVADTAAIVLGSRGMALSANFGDRGWGVYQTGHGSAHDLAGLDSANPVGQIHSLAMLLRESLGLVDAADLIERAVREVLGGGLRTADIAGPDSTVVSTGAMGDAIAAQVLSLAPEPV
jgi:isocitrate/isopropylmalate dehydrogenase